RARWEIIACARLASWSRGSLRASNARASPDSRPGCNGCAAWWVRRASRSTSPKASTNSCARSHPPSAATPSAVATASAGTPVRGRRSAAGTPPRSDRSRRASDAPPTSIPARSRSTPTRPVPARAGPPGGTDVEAPAARDRRSPARVAQDEGTPDSDDRRLAERDPDERLAPRRHLGLAEQAKPRVSLGRAGVQLEGPTRGDGVGEPPNGADPSLDDGRRPPGPGDRQDVAAI